MLFKTITAFQKLVEYGRTESGSWTAEYHGVIDVVVQASTLEQCRSRALEAFDEKLGAWVANNAVSAASESRTR